MLCPNGHENPATAAYCMSCGATVSSEGIAPPHPAPAAVGATATSSPAASTKTNRAPLYGILGFVALAVVALGAFLLMGQDDGSKGNTAAEASQTPEPLVLETAYDACIDGHGARTLTLGDEGRSLIINTESEYGPTAGLRCVIGELGTSQAVLAQLQATTSMMGVQDADDGSLHYQFSYHPDNGVNMVITDQSTE